VLLSIDVSGKAAGLTYGYSLQPFLDEDDTFAALSVGHPLFLQGQYFKGIEMVMNKLEGTLIRRSKRAKKDPARFQEEEAAEGTGELLERIRSRHRQKERKL